MFLFVSFVLFFVVDVLFPLQDGVGVDEKLSLRRVAVVEDFFDIIYSMHVETGPNGEQIRKHAGQKRTYKAISERESERERENAFQVLLLCLHVNMSAELVFLYIQYSLDHIRAEKVLMP